MMYIPDSPEKRRNKKSIYALIPICCAVVSIIIISLITAPIAYGEGKSVYSNGFHSSSSLLFASAYSSDIEIRSERGFWYYSEGNTYMNCIQFTINGMIDIDNSIVKLTRNLDVDIKLYVDTDNTESVFIYETNISLGVYDFDGETYNMLIDLATYTPECVSDVFMSAAVCTFYAIIEFQYYDYSNNYYNLVCKCTVDATFRYIPIEEQTIETIGKSLEIIGGCAGSIMLVGLVSKKRKMQKGIERGLHDFDDLTPSI